MNGFKSLPLFLFLALTGCEDDYSKEMFAGLYYRIGESSNIEITDDQVFCLHNLLLKSDVSYNLCIGRATERLRRAYLNSQMDEVNLAILKVGLARMPGDCANEIYSGLHRSLFERNLIAVGRSCDILPQVTVDP